MVKSYRTGAGAGIGRAAAVESARNIFPAMADRFAPLQSANDQLN